MRKRVSLVAAVVLVAIFYWPARLPSISDSERSDLVARFRFEKFPFPEVTNSTPHKSVREVHPDLARISAWISSVGAAVTLADLDDDGLANDLIHVDPRTDLVTIGPAPTTAERYKTFVLDTSYWAHNGYQTNTVAPTGTVAGDFNEDGLMDLMVYFWGRSPLLYLRTAGETKVAAGSFTPRELSDAGERWFTDCATQADLDGDGHVDLLIGNYFQDGARILDPKATDTVAMHQGKAKALNGGHKHVFLWSGGAQVFREVKDVFPEEISRGWTVALGAADLNGDVLPEIYFAHDFGPDRLLHNRSRPGKLEFMELRGERDLRTPKSCVLGDDSFKGMGCDFGDINGDGFLDIYVSNIATKFGLTESHFVWQSTGAFERMKDGIAPFAQQSEKLGLSRSGFGWDARLADFDNDGVVEAMQACGFIKGKINRWPELQALGTSNDKIVHNPRFWPNFKPGADLAGNDTNPFFVRAADGRYYDIAHELHLGEPMVSRGIAIADVDGDGRLDFACADQWEPSFFFRNEAPKQGEFLGLRLLKGSGTPAIGAVATITLADGRKVAAQSDGGSGHSGRRSPEIHFGLGAHEKNKAVSVAVKWRNSRGGVEQTQLQLAPGWHTINLEKGRTVAQMQ